MCGLPGGYPDDLIDVDLDALEGPTDGRRRDPGLQRRLPRPAAAADADRGDRDDRGAARPARAAPATTPARSVDRALAKLEAAGGRTAGATPPVDPGDDADADADPACARPAARTPSARGRQVRLTYYVPARDEESERVVDPRGVVTADGVAYLDAWCHSAEAPRLFRLDRIHEAEVLDRAVETAPEAAARPLRRALPAGRRTTTLVTLRAAAARPAGWSSTTRSRQVRPGRRRHGSRSTSWSPTSAGCAGCCCGSRPHARGAVAPGARRRAFTAAGTARRSACTRPSR